MKWAAAAGVGVGVAAPWWTPLGRAATEPYNGPFWLFVHASGGWDPTMLCDPKGRVTENDPMPVNTFFTDDILDVGPFRVAPVDGHQAWFERFQSDLLVINGVDNQTNSHETGTRFAWSGLMDPGVPALAAMIAGLREPHPSLSYLAQGGYTFTSGLVAPTRISETDAILDIAYPHLLDPEDDTTALLPDPMFDRVRAARAARLQRQHDAATLPRVRASMLSLQEARAGDNELAKLAEFIPTSLDSSGNGLIQQAQVAMACFKAGVSMTASLSIGGFDTHGDHDSSQASALQQLLAGVGFAMDEAERMGIADQVIVVMGSDFGRTPWYNEGNGKDHWSISSMMLMGPGIQGGRVIGATDDDFVPVGIDTATLGAGDSRLTPAHIHAALRELAGIEDTPEAAVYGVGDAAPVLG
jgi:hypothetical protein